MYSALLGSILFADLFIKILIGVGVLSGIAAGILLISSAFDWVAWARLIVGIVCLLLCVTTIVLGNSKYFQPEFIVARHAAPYIDSYVEKNPEAIYNPDTLLTGVNDIAFGLIESIQGLPDVLKKLSGMSPDEIRAQREKAERDREMEEFRAWKESQNK